jgi:preprotein translocase subunit Sec63
LLNAGRALAAETGRQPAALDGLSAKELFGLDYSFSLRELQAARRRLAMKFHPDLWAKATLLQRRAAEAAMQRVNAAFDELKAQAN